MNQQPGQTRREWLTTLARHAALTGVTALSAFLLVRPLGQSGQKRCQRSHRCSDCALLTRCDLKKDES